MNQAFKIKNFTDLNAWQVGHNLVLSIYRISKTFPREEIFGITSQMRRSAVSITSNIAEGFSRPSYKDKANFYSIALGSITELQNQLLIARDIMILNSHDYQELEDLCIQAHKITNGLIKSSKIIHNNNYNS